MPFNTAKAALIAIVLVTVGLIVWNIVSLSNASTRSVHNAVAIGLHSIIGTLALWLYYMASCTFA